MKCLAHPECTQTVQLEGVEVCNDCWNASTEQEREWFKKAVALYNQGLITRYELNDNIEAISCHIIGPSTPIHLDRSE